MHAPVLGLSEAPPEHGRGDPRLAPILHPRPDGPGFLLTEASRQRLLERARLSARSRRLLRDAQPVPVAAEAWEEARRRLVLGISTRFTDVLASEVRDEVQLRLFARPGTRLEYVGRGECSRRLTGEERSRLVALDVALGRRRYFFRAVGDDEREPAMSDEFRQTLGELEAWMNDPKARLVLSIGGGGFRLFAVTPVLKLLDHLLGDRRRVGEVWGCSGGALAGHVFADGFEPDMLDALGFDLAHRRHRSVNDGSNASLFRMGLRVAAQQMRGERGDPEIGRWLDILEAKQPDETRRHPRRPFFSMAVNPKKRKLFALTDRTNIRPHCEDLLVPSGRHHAVAASTAVPFVLPSQRDIAGWDEGDVWIDGSIVDENPLTLPFVKWSREREADPERTPPRLKVLLVDLNARTAEASLVQVLAGTPIVGPRIVKRAARVVDMLLDSRMMTASQLLSAVPEVDVRCLKLSLGHLGLRDPRGIPQVILGGRRRGSWQLISFGKGL